MGPHSKELIATKQETKDYRESVNGRKLTPWFDSLELEITGRSLLAAIDLFPPSGQCFNLDSKTGTDLSDAINRVAVWRSRCARGRIPHSIETSAALAEILLHDALSSSTMTNSARAAVSTMQTRLSYSTAIIRSVNGLADEAQRFNYEFKSVASLCSVIGLPGWIVDLRHDASHTVLPSLPCLRMAAKTMLGYLGDKYWNVMTAMRVAKKDRAMALLNNYRTSIKTGDNVGGGMGESTLLTPVEYAQEFVETVPIDMGLQILAEFFVLGARDNPSGRGALVPQMLPMSQEGFSKIKNQYHPLMLIIQTCWKGFTSFLIVEMIDSIIDTEASKNDERKLYFLERWTKYLLSKEWYSSLDKGKTNVNGKKSRKCSQPEALSKFSPAQLPILVSMNIPMNALCDRCAASGGTVSSNMSAVFEMILGKKRVEEYGLCMTEKKKTIEEAEEECDAFGLVTTSSILISLKDMEESLKDDNDGMENNSGPKQKRGWVECESWDACAIGTLPGYSLKRRIT